MFCYNDAVPGVGNSSSQFIGTNNIISFKALTFKKKITFLGLDVYLIYSSFSTYFSRIVWINFKFVNNDYHL